MNNVHIKNITNILLEIGERIEGNLVCDITPTNWVYEHNIHKIKNIQSLCKDKKKIIEIGINACHSLILMLLENPTAEYLLFDLNIHSYTEPVINYVKKSFPTTSITVIYGNSVETISTYIKNHPDELHTYDLIHLDGGHTEDIFSMDYNHSRQLLISHGIVIFDDYDYPEIKKFIDKKIEQKEIIEYTNVIKNSKHFIYTFEHIS